MGGSIFPENAGQQQPGAAVWPHAGGFSLLELILVIAIVAILAVMAAPRYASSAARYRADLAARRVVADLSLAQTGARTASASRTVIFSPASDEYELPGQPDLAKSTQDYLVELSGPPYEADLVSADLGGDLEVVFDGWGVPDTGGSIVIAVGGEERTVVVDPETGRASVQ